MIDLGEAERRQNHREAEAALKRLKVEVARASWKRCFRARLMPMIAILKFTLVPVAPGEPGWASMLMRMYVRWAEAHGYKVEWIEETGG
jgi:peptide chain release factor 2